MIASAWVHAWEAAMAEAGYPNARLDLYLDQAGSWTYTWNSDLDKFIAGEDQSDGAWDTAHVVFVLVDSLRPEWVCPSIMLQRMLGER